MQKVLYTAQNVRLRVRCAKSALYGTKCTLERGMCKSALYGTKCTLVSMDAYSGDYGNYTRVFPYLGYFYGDLPHGAGSHRPQGNTHIIKAHRHSPVSTTTSHTPLSHFFIVTVAVQQCVHCQVLCCGMEKQHCSEA